MTAYCCASIILCEPRSFINGAELIVGCGKTMPAYENFDGPYMWHNRRPLPQDGQEGQTSHPPNPGAPRRAIPRTKPLRVKAQGGTYRTSCGPFAFAMGLGERKDPFSYSDLQASPSEG